MQCICEKLGADFSELSPVCIGNLWLFRDLPGETLMAMSQSAIRYRKHRGEQVFLEGDLANTMFLIKGGRIKLSKLAESGNELILGYRKPGDFIGENILTDMETYPCSAWCQEETLICGFSKQQFNALILEHPQIGLQIIRNMSERIAWLSDQVGNLTVTNIEDRLHRVLQNVAKEQGSEDERGYVLNFSITHEELGFLIGAHRVSVTRAMNALKQNGKIAVDGKSLIIAHIPQEPPLSF
jgi:CRP/FNR family transcriptional regulator, cyclic AMP receptor protein